MSSLRRTPCVGICSTTYGDLVCRGCNRFAHEVVQWNGFADEQRELVWARLRELRAGAVLCHLRVVDAGLLTAMAQDLRVPDHTRLSQAILAFEVLRRGAGRALEPAELGIKARADLPGIELLQVIEKEFYERSLAQYEHNFHTLAQ